MTIYTGYFAYVEKYKAADLTPVSIARCTPKWYGGATMRRLAPHFSILKEYKAGRLSEQAYTERYWKHLESIKWNQTLQELMAISPQVVLLCYERPDEFCHRHILAKYLSLAGYPVTEVIPLTCEKNCGECSRCSGRQDANGHTWGFECLKYNEGIDRRDFDKTKIFLERRQMYDWCNDGEMHRTYEPV